MDFYDEEQYIAFMPITCPKCGETYMFLAEEEGEQDFECECGFKNKVRIESVE